MISAIYMSKTQFAMIRGESEAGRNKNAGRVIEPRKMYSCGHWIAIKESVVKTDDVLRLEGSSPECAMASIQDTTGV